ncbi:MAG: alkaline phosphatase [Bacteroidetes bacterium]|nr:alkaline phosphatase [Bacteroidota bacterium]
MRASQLIVLTAILQILSGCKGVKNQNSNSGDSTIKSVKPKNVILLIGDGMGLTQISTLHQDQDNTSAFSRFTFMGLINTSSASHKITDSAAGATAFSCGIRTYNGAIGVKSDSSDATTILETLSAKGWATGVVATSSVTHATPASFYAHTASRKNESEIAKQLLASNLNFFAGGGRQYFREIWNTPNAGGRWVIDTSNQFRFPYDMNSDKRYGFLMADDGMPKMQEGRGSFERDASRIAIDQLKKDKDGFFLMIEGSQIDWGGHANDYNYIVEEMKDFNEVLNMVLDFAAKDGNTLVIVTADHETGGLALASHAEKDANGKITTDYNRVEGVFNTGGHTNDLIPVFAFGPGSENFRGIYLNTGIYHKIMDLIQ